MNWSQIAGISRLLVPGVIGSLAMAHVITDSAATNWTAFALSILGSSVWSGMANTNLNLSKAVASVPGVQVVAGSMAPLEIQQAAHDPNVKDIIPTIRS
jgi:hypothetical protein